MNTPKHGERKTEIEIYLKYEQSPEVKKWLELLETSTDETTKDRSVNNLMNLSQKAMREVGYTSGQMNFDDAVFFDFSLSDKSKVELLQLSKGQDSRIEFLLSRIANAPSELLSVMYQL